MRTLTQVTQSHDTHTVYIYNNNVFITALSLSLIFYVERSCVCSFRTNRQSCPLLVRLRVLDPQKCLVVALCLPSLRERDSFTTTHTLDMKYTHTHYR